MDKLVTRREAIRGSLIGVAGVGLGGCGALDAPAAVEPDCTVDEVARSLIDEPTDPFVPLRRWLSAGLEPRALYLAALSAGARVVPPDDDMHGVLGLGAARLLSTRVRTEHALMPLFRTWADQHQAVVVSRGVTRPALPTTAPLATTAAAAAEAALLAAWEAWDATAADAAIQSLYDAGGRAAVVAPLTLYAQRNHNWVGHRVIWTAHALRSLDALGWGCARAIVRSLARTYASNRDRSSTQAFYANRRRLGGVRRDWDLGVDDAARVPALVTVLRGGDADACVAAVVAAIEGGLGTRTIWTALAVCAVEMSVRMQEASFGVHELDTINAFRFLSSIAPDRDTRLLMLLQAAAWRPEFRALTRGVAVFDEALIAVTPRRGAAPSLSTALASLSGDHVEAAHVLAAYFAGGGSAAEVIVAWPDIVVGRSSGDVHHYKYNCALIEETEAALPELRPALLLGITLRGPSPSTPLWRRHGDATASIASLGR